MTRRFCAHWAKSYSAVLQASTTSKLYQISMGWIVKCYQVRSQCQRKNAAVMVKTMYQNGLHDILPVLYNVASILATMTQDRLSSIAVINIERKYANKTMQNDMQRIIDIFGSRSNRSSYFFESSKGYVVSRPSWFCILETENICIILCICDQQVSLGQIMFSPPPPQQNFFRTPS